jgi:hypothetical protein
MRECIELVNTLMLSGVVALLIRHGIQIGVIQIQVHAMSRKLGLLGDDPPATAPTTLSDAEACDSRWPPHLQRFHAQLVEQGRRNELFRSVAFWAPCYSPGSTIKLERKPKEDSHHGKTPNSLNPAA